MRTRALRLPKDVEYVIRSLHPDLKRRVRAAVDLLRVTPEAGKALKGELHGWRSLRVGRSRIVYRESRAQIEVAAIGPRTSIYFETVRRLQRGAGD
jgi:mRNA interferase RelE/StbE